MYICLRSNVYLYLLISPYHAKIDYFKNPPYNWLDCGMLPLNLNFSVLPSEFWYTPTPQNQHTHTHSCYEKIIFWSTYRLVIKLIAMENHSYSSMLFPWKTTIYRGFTGKIHFFMGFFMVSLNNGRPKCGQKPRRWWTSSKSTLATGFVQLTYADISYLYIDINTYICTCIYLVYI